MNNPLFNTDFLKLGEQFIRPGHRAGNQGSFMRSIMVGLAELDLYFRRFRESAHYSLEHDYRKISIEKVLNDAFDPFARRIYIDNVAPPEQVYLYEPGDDRPVYLYEPADDQPVYLTELSTVELQAINFIVYLPLAIRAATTVGQTRQDVLINTHVNKYKDDSKNHRLLWIN
jgi:hypothetical protein